MSKVKINLACRQAGLWLPVFIWAGMLFYLSSIPNLRAVESNFWDEIIRSSAHFGFYALGYFLFFRAINFGKANLPAGRQGKNFWLPMLLTCLYALSDEIHQFFVPTRSFQIKDLIVDFCGSGLGGLILWRLK